MVWTPAPFTGNEEPYKSGDYTVHQANMDRHGALKAACHGPEIRAVRVRAYDAGADEPEGGR